eukprot:scaffold305753_cov26-Tisochrysis_lutea.AAC.2
MSDPSPTRVLGLRVGDVANSLVLLNSLLFVAAVLAHSFALTPPFFSPQFLSQGFCISNHGQKFLSSHALCFYVDTAAALLLWALGRRFSSMPGFEQIESAAGGVFAHGLAHLFSSLGDAQQPQADKSLPQILLPTPIEKRVVGISLVFLFFYALWRGILPKKHAVAHSLLHAVILSLLVPPAHGFTYVQTALLCVAVGYRMVVPAEKKDLYYDLAALMINLPIGFVSWLEASACDHGYRDLGGHVLYDSMIPICQLTYFAVAYLRQPPPFKKTQ